MKSRKIISDPDAERLVVQKKIMRGKISVFALCRLTGSLLRPMFEICAKVISDFEWTKEIPIGSVNKILGQYVTKHGQIDSYQELKLINTAIERYRKGERFHKEAIDISKCINEYNLSFPTYRWLYDFFLKNNDVFQKYFSRNLRKGRYIVGSGRDFGLYPLKPVEYRKQLEDYNKENIKLPVKKKPKAKKAKKKLSKNPSYTEVKEYFISDNIKDTDDKVSQGIHLLELGLREGPDSFNDALSTIKTTCDEEVKLGLYHIIAADYMLLKDFGWNITVTEGTYNPSGVFDL